METINKAIAVMVEKGLKVIDMPGDLIIEMHVEESVGKRVLLNGFPFFLMRVVAADLIEHPEKMDEFVETMIQISKYQYNNENETGNPG